MVSIVDKQGLRENIQRLKAEVQDRLIWIEQYEKELQHWEQEEQDMKDNINTPILQDYLKWSKKEAT